MLKYKIFQIFISFTIKRQEIENTKIKKKIKTAVLDEREVEFDNPIKKLGGLRYSHPK